jgi:hypothetical protein
MTIAKSSQLGLIATVKAAQSVPIATQIGLSVSYGPPASKFAETSQQHIQISRTAGANVSAQISQAAFQIAYKADTPDGSRLTAWTFILDGHRFYVLPLGEEGTWAFDTTTHEWCQFQTQGFNGINFNYGTMWGVRIIGGDTTNQTVLELDPDQSLDDGFRPVEHIVTGGVATRGRHAIGVANFTLTASTGDDQSITMPISLSFSDDNGVTYSKEFDLPLTNIGSQSLIWNSLGSFAAPGRVFRLTDYAGPVRLDGADVVLTIGDGADSGVEQNS